MIYDIVEYLNAIIFSFAMIELLQYKLELGKLYRNNSNKKNQISLGVFFCMIPLVLMHGLRSGIGADFYAYKEIYDYINGNSLYSFGGVQIEPGYLILNLLAPDFLSLNILVAVLLFYVLSVVLSRLEGEVNIGLAFIIYISTQFIYSMNGVRFSLAIILEVLAVTYLIERKYKIFVFWILCAALFHKTVIICLLFLGLADFQSRNLNKVRDLCFYFLIASFPLYFERLFKIVLELPILSSYASVGRYVELNANYRPTILLYLIPLLPLFFLNKRWCYLSNKFSLLLKIVLCKFPFIIMGYHNQWLARLVYCASTIEMILIPIFIASIKERPNRYVFTTFFILFYISFFVYYMIFGDECSSLPYRSIMSS